MTTLERFLKYVSFPTTSNSDNPKNPSTESQRTLALHLVNELEEMGIENIYYDKENCYVYAYIKGNSESPKLGFITHLDTSENALGDNIKPQFIYNYNGETIKYPNSLKMSPEDYPSLNNHIGKTLITTDGTTLLGGDNKAGIAEVMSMLEYFNSNSKNHGDIYICFTPDEEIRLGTKNFDFTKFPVDYAYTVDGSGIDEISYENFNAATATITIKGVSTHCGYAKNKMVNSLLLATKLIALIPDETPANTEKYEGFYHLDKMNGDIAETTLKILIRDFNINNFINRKLRLKYIVDKLNEQYNNCISLNIINSYFNMHNQICEHFHLIDIASKVASKLGITTRPIPIRGGTDGAEISNKGIPCPNLGTGTYNFHSVYEYACVEEMELSTELLIGIVEEYAKKENYCLKRKL